jgi:hypothetical protein
LVEGDGIAAVDRELGNPPAEEATATFVHADPYCLLETGGDSAISLDLVGCADDLVTKGMLQDPKDSIRDTARVPSAPLRQFTGEEAVDDLKEAG